MSPVKSIEVDRAERPVLSRPAFSNSIMQRAVRVLIAPGDVVVNGVVLRLPAGSCIGIGGGGSAGIVGTLFSDVEFTGRNGEKYKATKGMAIRLPLQHGLKVS